MFHVLQGKINVKHKKIIIEDKMENSLNTGNN